ncbi:MAG: sulfotransferase [Desulfobulbaceae bacterium]|nr:sulfotransferase [Desulfobulbaceae bacterium]
MLNLFITGMFRSGTTLLARMLNTHPGIACASDSMRPLFNSIRYTLAGPDYRSVHSRLDPLDDYFLSNTSLLKRILDSDFNITVDEDCRVLYDAVRHRAMPFSGLWADSFDPQGDFNTYKDFIEFGLAHVNEVYGKGRDVQVTAFKEVWSNEFVPAFLRSFPGSRSIIMFRDPRAVTASNYASGGRYPIFFLARQWRKLAFLTKYIKTEFPDTVHLIKYEDLVMDPDTEIRRICDFIGVPFDEKLLNIANYLDGDNKPWKQNTHYGYETRQTINTDSLTRWQRILEEPDLLAIELIARDWMEALGYECSFSVEALTKTHFTELRRWPTNELSEWIRAFSFDENEDIFAAEVAKEKARLQTVYSDAKITDDDRLLLHVR